MSRDLAAHEKGAFHKMYGVGAECCKCGDPGVTVRIWEKYGTTAHVAGGDITPSGIVGAVVLCERCGHGEVVPRSRILEAAPVAV
ncbi:MAG: hypothetical protein KJZ80_06310 [Hyphomicrobiaceae bacterium]|nr:hypothetical protein [Hyphomicrobiaceae bacterium]